MLGRRADGRVLKNIDPIIALTPYLMPMRCDAQVFLNYKLDYEKMARYIVAQQANGNRFTFMELIIAAFVRVVSELPEVNRFIVNKRLYARTELTVSFALLKETSDVNAIEENTVKRRNASEIFVQVFFFCLIISEPYGKWFYVLRLIGGSIRA